MAPQYPGASSHFRQAGFGHQNQHGVEEDDDFFDEDSFSDNKGVDKIRRNYLHQSASIQNQAQNSGESSSNSNKNFPETINVKLDESYFGREKRILINFLANVRSKMNSLQMFDPVKNQNMKEQQETWNENEKYTLDSLNEIKIGPTNEKFQWSRPEDGRLIWQSKLQYFLAITSYSIGLGNVIRFPILVQKNGGLAFIIPFVIMLIVEGIPLFYLELAVGQRMRKAAISCWNLVSPLAAGIGFASAAVSFIIGLYYNTMVAWTLIYLFAAGGAANSKVLPFAQCPVFKNLTNRSSKLGEKDQASLERQNRLAADCQVAGPYQHYWNRETLNASQDVSEWSSFNWSVMLCLVAAWLLSYLCLFKGLSSSKRVVYVASTFPYVILTIFFIKAASLDGMSDGIYYLFAPEWSKLAEPYIWLQAAAQVFFSLGLGFGGLIALSSYNQVNNNCYKDSIKVSLINFLTSIYAGIVIFAILGYKANLSNNKCLEERDQMIDYYLSDYNLKAIDYGAAFNINGSQEQEVVRTEASIVDDNNNTSAGGGDNNRIINSVKDFKLAGQQQAQFDYYDSQDAIASIKSLDKILNDFSSNSKADYDDRDREFEINASSIIDAAELERIIENIPDLPVCSVAKELENASQGPGLVFVVITEAIGQFKDAQLWSIIFFLMLLTLGLDSQLGNLEGLLSSLADLNFSNTIKRQWMTGFICFISLIISIVMFAHGAGSYMFAIFDEYAASFSLVLIALFELIAISYIYGLKRFCDDCELMTGKRPPFLILLSWRYISPILLLIVILATVREFTISIEYEAWIQDHWETKVWPTWCIIFGIFLILSCVIWIPLIAILKIFNITIIPEENLSHCWFPAEELREFHDIQEEHKVTKMERLLFGFRSDDD